MFIHIPFKNAVVKSCADNSKGHDTQNAVEDIVFAEAEGLAAAQTISNSKNQAEGDDHAVEMDAERTDVKIAGRVQFQTQTGERDGGKLHVVSS